MPSHNGHRVPQTHPEPRHRRRCQGQPGPHAAHRTQSQWVAGPGGRPERTSGRGSESARPRTPNTQAIAAPPGRPCAAPGACKPSAVGLVTGPHAHSPRTHSQWVVGSGRTPQRTGGSGWESAQSRMPHTQARGPPSRAPSCRPRSAQSQLAKARAVGLVTGPHARAPRTRSQWVAGPGRTPERTGGRGWKSAQPRTPHTQARGAPPGCPGAASTARKASSQERALWGWRRISTSATPALTASG